MPDRIRAGLRGVLDNLPISSINLQLMPDFCGPSQMSKLKRLKFQWLERHEVHGPCHFPMNGRCDQYRLNEQSRTQASLERQTVIPKHLPFRQGQIGFEITLEQRHFVGMNRISNTVCGSSLAYLTVV